MTFVRIGKLNTTAALLALTTLTACLGGGGSSEGSAGNGGPTCPTGQVQQNGQCVTPIAAPGGVTASAGEGQVTITWDAVAGASSYNLYKSDRGGLTKSNYGTSSAGGKMAGATAPSMVTGLTNGTTYYFVVTAVDANGESIESSEVAATPWAAPPVTIVGRLNDTGIKADQCYLSAISDDLGACSSAEAMARSNAQDGMIGRDANPATNGGVDGKLGFSFSAVEGGCVLDNVTGLMWEVKTADNGLRDWRKAYTNYGDGRDGDSSAYAAAINATALCGHADWRLPTAGELLSIADFSIGYPGPAIDKDWFPNTPGAGDNGMSGMSMWAHWSASPVADYPAYALQVSSLNGGIDIVQRLAFGSVRLVRAGLPPAAPRYALSADGQEVTDRQTGLIWRRCVEGMNWDETTCAGTPGTFSMLYEFEESAFQRAAALAAATGKAWRLPNIKELFSLIEPINPMIDPIAFPAAPADSHWSTTPSIPNPLLGVGANFGWYVSFSDLFRGVVNYSFRLEKFYIRLVRDAP